MSAINSPAKKEIGPWMFFMAPLGPLQDREEFISFIRRSSNKTRLKNEQRMCSNWCWCWYECMQIFSKNSEFHLDSRYLAFFFIPGPPIQKCTTSMVLLVGYSLFNALECSKQHCNAHYSATRSPILKSSLGSIIQYSTVSTSIVCFTKVHRGRHVSCKSMS